ncbi:MAG: hypothetical protein WHS44_09340 [Fimbriimonadales bacterium]|nr:MAG: hypothetical protein KatS3mg018_1159 [Fimbriimonadales bacterium]
MKRWMLMSLTLLTLALNLTACGTQGGEGEAAAPPTTNPMGQQSAPDTAGAAAEERKAGGY